MDPVWEKLHASRHWGRYPAEDLVRTLMRRYSDRDLRKKTRVLEVGCGAGANLTFFVKEGFQVYGIDGAPSAIANASRLLSGLCDGQQVCELHVGDFSRLDYADEMFDVVVDYISLCTNTVADIKATLGEVRRVLKPGGFFYSRGFGSNTSGAATGVVIEPGTTLNPLEGPCRDMGTSHFFDEDEIRALYADWPKLVLQRVSTECLGVANSFTEEWIVWATK